MAMTYSSLIAPKGNPGSIANWVSYTLLDLTTIVDEAQALIYGLLRCREMTADYRFTLPLGNANIPLPARFLDPIGRIRFTSINRAARHKDSGFVQSFRNYDETSGTLGTDPFTATNGSPIVTVSLTGHGFNQDSVFNTSGAVPFNGVAVNGTFPISGIVSADAFTIDISTLGATPTADGSGGGDAVAYVCDNLVQGIPNWWGIWNETIYFDTALNQRTTGILQYYQSLPILSVSNQSNFLTNRYPQLMRTACVTAAADFMKDDNEYQKGMTRLGSLIQSIAVDNDGYMRGMELDTETP
jgi:hypothetical protein